MAVLLLVAGAWRARRKPSEPTVGVEPTTYRLQGDCSDQLRYTGAPASYGGGPQRSPATHRFRGFASSSTCWNVGRFVVRKVFGIRPGANPVRAPVLRHADGSVVPWLVARSGASPLDGLPQLGPALLQRSVAAVAEVEPAPDGSPSSVRRSLST